MTAAIKKRAQHHSARWITDDAPEFCQLYGTAHGGHLIAHTWTTFSWRTHRGPAGINPGNILRFRSNCFQLRRSIGRRISYAWCNGDGDGPVSLSMEGIPTDGGSPMVENRRYSR